MNILLRIFFIFFITTSILADSGKIQDALKESKELISKQTNTLSNVRESISAEKLPLTLEIMDYENQGVRLQDEYAILKHDIMHYDQSLVDLNTKASIMKEKIVYLNEMMLEQRKNFSKNMSSAEEIFYQNSLTELDDQLFNSSPFKKYVLLESILSLSLSKIKLNLGGNTFPGKCLTDDGELLSGKFIQWGAITFFVSNDFQSAGFTQIKLNSKYPSLAYSIDPILLKDVLEGNSASIPVDLTSGKALKLKFVNKSLLSHIKTGGVIMIPILILGMFSLFAAIWKFFNLRQISLNISDVLSIIVKDMKNNNIDQATSCAASLPVPFSPVLLEGIYNYKKSREELEEVMHEKILLQIPHLEKWLSFLSVSAAAAPLLGLLGTVTGMINTFKMVSMFGTGDANILSGGISEALITTEFGLIVAIPTLLMHAYLARKVKTIIYSLEQLMISFINQIKIKDN